MPKLAYILVAVLATASPQTGFSVADILSAPFSEHITAAPAANRFAWVMNARGIRNIWVAESLSFRARQLTAYKDDDGQELGELTWTQDAASIIYTRSGDLGMRREVPNPTSLLDRPVQSIWNSPTPGEPRSKSAKATLPRLVAKAPSPTSRATKSGATERSGSPLAVASANSPGPPTGRGSPASSPVATTP